jgi:hypothetical protein
MLVYMLYKRDGDYYKKFNGEEIKHQKTEYMIGGGSSTPKAVRMYKTKQMAEKMQRIHFPYTRIKEIEL